MNLIQVEIDSDLKHVLSGFNALSDPLRLRIVDLLSSQELSVGELRSQLDVGWSKLSFHLKQLKEAKLLRAHQRGRSIYYSLNLSQFVIFRRIFNYTPSPTNKRDENKSFHPFFFTTLLR